MMMFQDQRLFKRFDISTVVEYKPLNGSSESACFGVMKNFSYGGFGLETQHVDLEPGEELEFNLRHAGSGLYVADKGKVVWKDKGNKFEYMMGVKFGEMDIENRMRMLEIVAAAGDIPVDFLLLEGDAENGSIKKEEVIIGEPVNDVSDSEKNVEAVNESAQQAPPIPETHELDALREETNKADNDVSADEVQKNRKWAYVLAAVFITLISGYVLSMMLEGRNRGLQEKISNPEELADRKDIEIKSPITIMDGFGSDDKAENVQKTLDKISATGNKEYFVQVGAWSNPDNAKAMLERVKKHYPDAYILNENKLRKLRIPGIISESRGNQIVSDIEKKFKLKPLLVLKK